MIVVTLLRSRGDFYPEHVNRLRKQVKRAMPHARFMCISDVTVPCERIPMKHRWARWWGQLELFRPGLFDGPVMYMDLDTTVLRDPEIVPAPGEFWTLVCPYRGTPTSGVMAWNGDFSHIYEAHAGRKQFDPAQWVNGGIFPHVRAYRPISHVDGFYSYKKHVQGKGVPADARVVYFHGKPRPWDLPEVTLAVA